MSGTREWYERVFVKCSQFVRPADLRIVRSDLPVGVLDRIGAPSLVSAPDPDDKSR